jgi:hypothetical protein
MIRKIAIIAMVFSIVGLSIPLTTAENISNESGPEFEVGLEFCISVHGPSIYVKNVGDATAHNVKLTDLTVDGFVVYNNRVTSFRDDVEPGHAIFTYPNSFFIGFGIFKASITVTCDEGITGTGIGNGIIIGPLIIVP